MPARCIVIEGAAEPNANGVGLPLHVELDSETERNSVATALAALGVKVLPAFPTA